MAAGLAGLQGDIVPKGVEADQLANSGTANARSAGLYGNATNLYGSLAPALTAEAVAPSGYTPAQKAAMNTAGQQSAGGTQAAATGQGALLASRTKNAGTADAAIADSARKAGALASNAALSTEVKNADLQQRQRQEGLSGLGSLYGETLGASDTALGLSNQALQGAGSSAANNPWNKLLLQGVQSGGVAAAGAGY